jgi:CRISPR-associated protein Cas2
MRRCYLVCYDIRDPKRLRKIHKTMKAYGEPWQYSVFCCFLKSIDRVRMETDLRDIMVLTEDQVLIVDLGADEEAAKEAARSLGPKPPEPESGVVVI